MRIENAHTWPPGRGAPHDGGDDPGPVRQRGLAGPVAHEPLDDRVAGPLAGPGPVHHREEPARQLQGVGQGPELLAESPVIPGRTRDAGKWRISPLLGRAQLTSIMVRAMAISPVFRSPAAAAGGQSGPLTRTTSGKRNITTPSGQVVPDQEGIVQRVVVVGSRVRR